MHGRTGSEFRKSFTVSFIIYLSDCLKPSENYGSTSCIISEKNGILSNIFGHQINSTIWAVSKRLILGNLPRLTKRASSVSCDNLQENRTSLNTWSPEIRLEHCQSMLRISSEMRHQIEHRSRSQYLEIWLIRQREQSPSVTSESPSTGNSKKLSTPGEDNPWELD